MTSPAPARRCLNVTPPSPDFMTRWEPPVKSPVRSSVAPVATLRCISPPSVIGAATVWLPPRTLMPALCENASDPPPPFVVSVCSFDELKLIVRSATGVSTSIVTGDVVKPLKFTNASGELGDAAVDHLVASDHAPPLVELHDVPVGGVTRAQALSTRSSSTCTPGTPVPCRSTKPARDGTPDTVRSVPATGAARIGEAGVDAVGAAAAPSDAGAALIHSLATSSVPLPWPTIS